MYWTQLQTIKPK